MWWTKILILGVIRREKNIGIDMSNLLNWSVEIYHHTLNMQFFSFAIVRSCKKLNFSYRSNYFWLLQKFKLKKFNFWLKSHSHCVESRRRRWNVDKHNFSHYRIFIMSHNMCYMSKYFFFQTKILLEKFSCSRFFAQTNMKKVNSTCCSFKM